MTWLRRRATGATIRQTLRIVLACAIAYGLAAVCRLQEGYWALVTAVVVTQPALEDTVRASRNRVLGTLIGAAAGLVVLEAGRYGFSLFLLFWCALLPLAIITAITPSLRLSCITLVILVLIPADGAPFARPLDRVYGILLGTLASIAVALVVRD
jgi:uncharacterized membrane protein YccC